MRKHLIVVLSLFLSYSAQADQEEACVVSNVPGGLFVALVT